MVKEYFGYEDYPDGIGQTWAFADQPGDLSNECINGTFKGKKIHDLWQNHPELFRSRFQGFPFIISLVGPSGDLSIQVHPDKRLAAEQGFEIGKNEAWYFLKTDNSSIVYGHNAADREELCKKIEKKQWEGLFRTVPVHDGDFVYIPAGVVHAIGKNNVVYEIQQATDLTYRIYDYDRIDTAGNPRELHTEKALRSIREIKEAEEPLPKERERKLGEVQITEYISNESFTVVSIESFGKGVIPNNGYKVCTVVRGEGEVNHQKVSLGDNFLISDLCKEIHVEGMFWLLITCEESVIDHL